MIAFLVISSDGCAHDLRKSLYDNFVHEVLRLSDGTVLMNVFIPNELNNNDRCKANGYKISFFCSILSRVRY